MTTRRIPAFLLLVLVWCVPLFADDFPPRTLQFAGSTWTLAFASAGGSYEYVTNGETVNAYSRLLTVYLFPPLSPEELVAKIRAHYLAEPCPEKGFGIREKGTSGVLYSRDYSVCRAPSTEFSYSRIYSSGKRTIDLSVAVKKRTSAAEIAALFSDLKKLAL